MFIVIERNTGGFWQDAAIVTDEDGKNKEFDTIEEAQAEVDECQDGIIVGDETIKDSLFIVEELEKIEDLLQSTDDTKERAEIFRILERLLNQL